MQLLAVGLQHRRPQEPQDVHVVPVVLGALAQFVERLRRRSFAGPGQSLAASAVGARQTRPECVEARCGELPPGHPLPCPTQPLHERVDVLLQIALIFHEAIPALDQRAAHPCHEFVVDLLGEYLLQRFDSLDHCGCVSGARQRPRLVAEPRVLRGIGLLERRPGKSQGAADLLAALARLVNPFVAAESPVGQPGDRLQDQLIADAPHAVGDGLLGLKTVRHLPSLSAPGRRRRSEREIPRAVAQPSAAVSADKPTATAEHGSSHSCSDPSLIGAANPSGPCAVHGAAD